MMNTRLFLTALLGLAALATPVSVADTVAGTPDASVRYGATQVGSAVAVLPLVNGIYPSTTARYYIYLCSAGWCGPCNKEMPKIVEAYSGMREGGLVELILVDFDSRLDDAQDFITRHGVNFPATMHDNGTRLPGFKRPRGIPTAIIVDAEGNLVRQMPGAALHAWKQVIAQYEQSKGLAPSFPGALEQTLNYEHGYMLAEMDEESDDVDEADSGTDDSSFTGSKVAEAMNNIAWFNGKPNLKAEYYIYLQSASWCGPCCKEMPEIVKAYKAMKRTGRVELVLLSGDKTLKAAKAYLKEYKAKFPGVMNNAEGVVKLPGANKIPSYFPAAVIVKADGTVVTSGHGSIIRNWRQYTIGAGK